MATVIEMPKLSDTMEEGTIAKWNIKEGDTVASGDVVAEVETDKATMDLEAFDGGTVLKILVEEGDAAPLGAKLVILGEKGEDISGLVGDEGSAEADSDDSEEKKSDKKESGEKDSDKKESEGKETEDKESGEEKVSEKKKDKKDKDFDPLFGDLKEGKKAGNGKQDDGDGRVKASPLARKMAEERGIDVSLVKGSGPQGRIVKADVENFKEEDAKEAPAAQKEKEKEKELPKPSISGTSIREDKEIKVSQMRKTIGKRLAESKFTSPHFYETVDIDMKRAIEVREAMNEISDVKISFNDLVVKACAVGLRRHPWVNSSWMGDVIRMHGDVNIAVAVAVEEGLLTPVIRHADQKGLRDISIETKDFANRAREKKLQPEDWEGSTFTVSNLGMFGIEEFTAIINPPNAAILAIGAIRDVPVVENGQVVPGKRMKVTMSSDHRVVDGAKAAEFLNTVRSLLENPASMLL
ncbi:MAG: pyruvate dehydrogenase complex dihydrolipoamide acetyltransferase [Balneolaceae bacterium]|nr:MAG: pyruvate dehydrogenase complex dihydrolipoamide acetyltransferase [Balneolaceae bacterium]